MSAEGKIGWSTRRSSCEVTRDLHILAIGVSILGIAQDGCRILTDEQSAYGILQSVASVGYRQTSISLIDRRSHLLCGYLRCILAIGCVVMVSNLWTSSMVTRMAVVAIILSLAVHRGYHYIKHAHRLYIYGQFNTLLIQQTTWYINLLIQ